MRSGGGYGQDKEHRITTDKAQKYHRQNYLRPICEIICGTSVLIMNFNFLKYRKIYYLFSGLLILGSILSVVFFGLKFGIDFLGGSLLEIEYKDSRPTPDFLKGNLKDLGLGEIIVQPTEEKGMIFRMKDIDEEIHQKVLEKLGKDKMEEKRFETIGPVIGREIAQKTRIAIILALVSITLYVALAFRKISRIVASWKYSIAALIALFHDVLIPIGIFAILGKFLNVEITIPFVAALLTILGYSINDTVVVYDRIRENLLRNSRDSFDHIVNLSLNQTLGRSLNTVLTTLFPLLAIYFLGGETIRYFALALIIGIASGAYSSIFVASSLLISWNKPVKAI